MPSLRYFSMSGRYSAPTPRLFDLLVQHDVFQAHVAGDVHPPVLLVVEGAKEQEELELVLLVSGQAVVEAWRVQIVDVELVDELVGLPRRGRRPIWRSRSVAGPLSCPSGIFTSSDLRSFRSSSG